MFTLFKHLLGKSFIRVGNIIVKYSTYSDSLNQNKLDRKEYVQILVKFVKNKGFEQVEWVFSKLKKYFKMNLHEIKSLDFVEILQSKLGIEPVKKFSKSFQYISPLRDEKMASFSVTKKKPYDLFYDHGTGVGGSIVDFFMIYLNTDAKGVYDYFNECNNFSFNPQKNKEIINEDPSLNYHILSKTELNKKFLIQYLNDRRIDIEIAKKYCVQINYKMHEKNYYAIGFKTQKGFELRNKYIKICLEGKGVTWIKNEQNLLKIFESWTDFLSYLTLKKNDETNSDFLVLNSVSLLKKSIPEIKIYDSVQGFLDNDSAGKNASIFLQDELKSLYEDKSSSYGNFKDINDYLMHSTNGKVNMRF